MFYSTLEEIPAKAIHHQLQYNHANIIEINNIIAFSSGQDRVGKTTIAVNIAVLLAQSGLKIGLLDAIPNSFHTSEVLGIADRYIPNSKDTSGDRFKLTAEGGQRQAPSFYGGVRVTDNFGVKLVSIGSLIEQDPLEDWCDEWCDRGRRSTASPAFARQGTVDHWLNQQIKQVLEEVQWGKLDYLIVNLPPGMGDIQITLAQALPLNGVVMVATDEKDTHPDIYKTLRMFEKLQVPILGLVENKSNIFGADISKRKYEIRESEEGDRTIRVPFLGYVPLDFKVSQHRDKISERSTSRGLPIVLAEPLSMFTSALQIVVWAISSQITISGVKS